ncbi:MAG: prepilin-type N-terminal cleavage/methylation domain-containing protein [Anaerovoracaceae bacterium]
MTIIKKMFDNRASFTLVELLVVVAVLALLASIVFSNLTGAREQAKISNALSFQSQIQSLLGSDLIGRWSFNEGTGTVAYDSSGYGNNGVLKNFNFSDSSGWSNDTPSPGGYSLKFDGSNDYVDCGNVGNYQEITLSAWIKPTDNGTSNGSVNGHLKTSIFGHEK